MNLFAVAGVGNRYARARPYFHPLVVAGMRELIGLTEPLLLALDVGCGTGQSTRALLAIASQVVGIDPAAEMIAEAEPDPRIAYGVGAAEALPMPDSAIDVVTAGLAFHGFDRPRFLAEARRALKRDGWMVLYSDGFGGRMSGNPDYARWNAERYLARFPTPPRDAAPFGEPEAAQAGFARIASDSFSHDVVLSLGELVDYLTTQTNVIAAIDADKDSLASATDWLTNEIGPLFGSVEEALPFDCRVDDFQRL